MTERTYALRATLEGSRDPCWRRLRLPARATLHRLHLVLQSAFDWDGAESYRFEAEDVAYGPSAPGNRSSRKRHILGIAEPGSRFRYVCEPGRMLVIEVEDKLDTDGADADVPVCLDGEGACPAPDAGDPGRRDVLFAARGVLAPDGGAAFDLKETNRRLRRHRVPDAAGPPPLLGTSDLADLMSFPRSYSVAPAPLFMERFTDRMTRLLTAQTFFEEGEIARFARSRSALDRVNDYRPETPTERAREMVFDAWEAKPPERYDLARQALALDPAVSDGYLILAELEERWRKRLAIFRRAAAQADAARAAFFEANPIGEEEEIHGYSLAELRPWFRAQVALGRHLSEGGHLEEARRVLEEALALDVDDRIEARYDLLAPFHRMGDLDALADLLARFPDDVSTTFQYERAWLAFIRLGDSPGARRARQRAIETNPHPAVFFADRSIREPTEEDDEWEAWGEALDYLLAAKDWWVPEIEARNWLAQGLDGDA